jgi:hypothetical protein
MEREKPAKQTSANTIATRDGARPSRADIAALATFLRAMESDYDQDLSRERRELWLKVLEMPQRFSVQEIVDAFVQVQQAQMEQPGGWTGFPRRMNVIAQMNVNRANQARERAARRDQEFYDEMRELKRRAAAGEKFYGLADLMRDFEQIMKKKAQQAMTGTKSVEAPASPASSAEEIALARRREELARQAEQIRAAERAKNLASNEPGPRPATASSCASTPARDDE